MLSINANLSVKIPFLGTKDLVALSGDLNKGVTAGFNAYAVKGSVTCYLRNGKEVWIKLTISSIIYNADKDYKIFVLCKTKLYCI